MWSSLQISLTIALTTERNFCQERNVKLDNVLKKKQKGKNCYLHQNLFIDDLS